MAKMGKVKVEFTNSDLKSTSSKQVGDKEMYKLLYEMEVDLYSNRGDLQFRAIFNGSTKGDATIQFEQSYGMTGKE